jgi:hypothetical protein
MSNYHLAQINIARMLAPIDDPVMAEFGGLPFTGCFAKALPQYREVGSKPTRLSARRASMY